MCFHWTSLCLLFSWQGAATGEVSQVMKSLVCAFGPFLIWVVIIQYMLLIVVRHKIPGIGNIGGGGFSITMLAVFWKAVIIKYTSIVYHSMLLNGCQLPLTESSDCQTKFWTKKSNPSHAALTLSTSLLSLLSLSLRFLNGFPSKQVRYYDLDTQCWAASVHPLSV